jgi:Glyoxalase-like domain
VARTSTQRSILRCVWIVRTILTVSAMATHWTLGCDASDPHRLADFWAQALGYVKSPATTIPIAHPSRAAIQSQEQHDD